MSPTLRAARASDTAALVELRALMFADMGAGAGESDWRGAAAQWFSRAVEDPLVHVAVIEEQHAIVGCGMVEIRLGAPGPDCPGGRTAHVSNLVTRREARGRGLGSRCLAHLLAWAAERADRVELFASESGIGLYRRTGFVEAPHPAMRLALTPP